MKKLSILFCLTALFLIGCDDQIVYEIPEANKQKASAMFDKMVDDGYTTTTATNSVNKLYGRPIAVIKYVSGTENKIENINTTQDEILVDVDNSTAELTSQPVENQVVIQPSSSDGAVDAKITVLEAQVDRLERQLQELTEKVDKKY